MRARKRKAEVFGLSFMDCICCGFGATILLYMILNSGQTRRADDALDPLRAETNRLEQEVLEGQANLVELRNTLDAVRQDSVTTAGLSTRLIEVVKQSQDELATFEAADDRAAEPTTTSCRPTCARWRKGPSGSPADPPAARSRATRCARSWATATASTSPASRSAAATSCCWWTPRPACSRTPS